MRTPSRSIEMTTSPPFESFFSILTPGSRPPGGDGGDGGEGSPDGDGGVGGTGGTVTVVREPSATLPIV